MTRDPLPFEELLAEAERDGRVLHRDDIYCSGPPVDMVSEEILAFVSEHVGSSVLDVGCGVGPYVARLAAQGKRCLGIDINPDVVSQARNLGRDVRVMSAYDLEFADSSFESVIMIETLEHLPEYERALEEAARVAADTIVVTVPDMSVLPLMSKRQVVPWHLLEKTHVNFFTPEVLRRTLLRFAKSCDAATLGAFFEVDGEIAHMHASAVAYV